MILCNQQIIYNQSQFIEVKRNLTSFIAWTAIPRDATLRNNKKTRAENKLSQRITVYSDTGHSRNDVWLCFVRIGIWFERFDMYYFIRPFFLLHKTYIDHCKCFFSLKAT